jgi:hypothetical protein
MIVDPDYDALANVLFGYAASRMAGVASNNLKLAHYTTAENALNIIRGETMWLRNAAVMNDHSEIEHGRAILAAAMDRAPLGGRLLKLLDRSHLGLANRIVSHLKNHRRQMRERVFMISLCEIAASDRLGRLSMWRAYGGKVSGAALVFNSDVFEEAQLPLMSFGSPVLYGEIAEFDEQLGIVVDRLDASPHLVTNVSTNTAFIAASSALDFAVLSVKHVGFEEEREWRVLHRPFDYPSDHVQDEIVSIGGTPQLIYKMPLTGRVGMNAQSMTLDRLLHRVIIGPSLHPETTRRALVEALRKKGVRTPEARVITSEIPLRQTG